MLAQEPIAYGATRSDGELTVAPALLARLDGRGRVLTGDALCCQRHRCPQVLAASGDERLLVKENQPTLYQNIALLFDPPGAVRPQAWTTAVRRAPSCAGMGGRTRCVI